MKNRISNKTELLQGQWAASLVGIYPKTACLTTSLLHYWALNNRQHLKPDSSEYTNTIKNYKYLVDACDKAQYLGLIPFHLFSEHNNLSDLQNIPTPAYSCHIRQCHVIFKHMFDRFCTSYVRCMAAKLNPIHTEIWLGNSNSAPLIKPIADRYNINLIASHQPISITTIFQFVRRISQARRPIRILHLSDFDPADVNHHLRTKAKLNMLLDHFHLKNKHNLKIRHLMLSADQCAAFALPTEPTGRNSANPKTELLAIEANQPGYIAETLEKYLKRYIDLSALKKTTAATHNALQNILPQFNRIIDSNTSLEIAIRLAEKQLLRNWNFDRSF